MAESLAAHEVPLVGDFSVSAPNPNFADARIGVITFPGTLDDRDAARAVRLAGGTVVELWHDDEDLKTLMPSSFPAVSPMAIICVRALSPRKHPSCIRSSQREHRGLLPCRCWASAMVFRFLPSRICSPVP